MKLKKIISLLSTFAIAGAMMTSVSAAPTADTAELVVDAVYSEDNGVYCVEYIFNTVGELGVTKSGTKYSGTALYAFSMVINGASYDNINEDLYIEMWDDADAVEDNAVGLAIGKLQTNAAKKLATVDGEPNLIVRIWTNYAEGDKTEAEIAAEYATLSSLNVKTVTIDALGQNNNPTTAGTIVTYAINDDGTKHPDADYGLKVVNADAADEPTPDPEPEVPVTGSTGVCGKPEAGNAMVNPKTGAEENTVVTSFKDVELTAPSFVVKNGDVTKTFDASYFPTNVKGAASFIAIIRYAASAVTSNVFEMELFNGETSLGTATYVAE